MSIGEVAASFLLSQIDWSILHTAAEAALKYRWGHPSLEAVGSQFVEHQARSKAALLPHFDGGSATFTFETKNIPETYAKFQEVRRDNLHMQRIIDTKKKSLEKKYRGPDAEDRRNALAGAQTYLEKERTLIGVELRGLEQLYKPAGTEQVRERLRDAQNAARGFAYRRPITTGVFLCAGAAILPLWVLYEMLKPSKNTAR